MKVICICLFALFALVIGVLVYFRMMPRANEILLENGVPVVAVAGARHEILATGYSEVGNVRFRIRDISGDPKIIDANLTLDKKRYASGKGGLSYYTVVVPSLEELLSIHGNQKFTFAVEWESNENMEVILKIYKN
jgi:hypothetical protein